MNTPQSPEIEPVTIHKVIHHAQLEQHTSDGWKIVESFDQNVAMQVTTPEYDPPYTQNGCASGGHYISAQSVALGLVRMFLISRESDSPIPALQSTIVELNSELKQKDAHAQSCEKTIAQYQKDLSLEKDDMGRLKKSFEQVQDSKRKLEGDIGKLRIEIGDSRMREILGR
jgi:hypothetical protein